MFMPKQFTIIIYGFLNNPITENVKVDLTDIFGKFFVLPCLSG